jgi:Alr-MurF fusion protein
MPKITLKQIALITHGMLTGNGDQIIEMMETDSRNLSIDEKSIFIAIKGLRHDGHNHINELYERGLRNFLVARSSRVNLPKKDVNIISVDDPIDALQKLASFQRQQLKMPVIAITGSNGKTVVKEWLFQCLSDDGIVSRSPKSYNSQIGVPLSLWMLDPAAKWSIIEAGISLPGEMIKLQKMIAPDFGIFTNLGSAHQENFKTLEEKAREKLNLFTGVKTLYYCRDHEIIHEQILRQNEPDRSSITWSVSDKSVFLQVKNIRKTTGTAVLSLQIKKQDYNLEIPFADDASIENCLQIISFLFHQKFSAQYIQKALHSLNPVAMRLEQVKGIQNSTLINDSYNSDINSLRIALEYLALQKQHQKHSLILSDIRQSGQQSEELYAEVVRLVNSYNIDQFIAIGRDIIGYSNLPDNTLKYLTTNELLLNLPSIDFTDHAVLIKGAREFSFEQIVNALSEKKHTTILEINLNNLVYNLNYFRDLLSPGTRVMVMVKALSYGSGSYEIANLLQHEKVDYLGVAFTDEGIELRLSGITLPIMVMAPTQDTYDKIIQHNLEPEIYSFSGLRALSKTISANQLPEYPVHLKLDTGMHRLGFLPDEMVHLADDLTRMKNIRIKAMFSHLAVSDNPEEDAFTLQQFRLFNEMYSFMAGRLGYKPMRHILNSAGIERFPQAHFEMVRLGIGLHGISATKKILKPVSTLKTRISQIKKIPKTDTVGYNRRGILNRDSLIGIIPIGYADGLDRKLGNQNGHVIINNAKVPFIGDICMDISMIDLTDNRASEGDEVIIFGENNPIGLLAEQVGTIPYEILTNVSTRVKRIYINE